MMTEADKRGPQNPEDWDICLNTGRLSYPELKKAFDQLEQRAIKAGANEEYFLRRELLFRFNDAYRGLDAQSLADIEGEPDNMERSEEDRQLMRANIDSIISLGSADTNEDKIYVAEMLRETGRFSECLEVLNGIDPSQPIRIPYSSMLLNAIREGAESNNDKVAELDISDEEIMVVM